MQPIPLRAMHEMRYILALGQLSKVTRGGQVMLIRSTCAVVALAAGLATVGYTLPAQALTAKECRAKFNAAQQAGTLSGQKYADYRKAECGTAAAAAPAPTPAPAPKSSAAAPSNAVFPSAINSKYSSEKAGTARMHTCLDQYNANKASNANGGLKWIQRGGGYYSECNKRLKA
jgi:hypothetical protein